MENKESKADTKQSSTKENVVGGIFWAVIIACIFTYCSSKNSAEEQQRRQDLHVETLKWTPSTISLKADASLNVQNVSSSTYLQRGGVAIDIDWMYMAQEPWIVFNPYSASKLCKAFMETLVSEKPVLKTIRANDLKLWISSVENQTANVKVWVPVFKKEPLALQNNTCPGISWDNTTKKVKVGNKQITFLMALP